LPKTIFYIGSFTGSAIGHKGYAPWKTLGPPNFRSWRSRDLFEVRCYLRSKARAERWAAMTAEGTSESKRRRALVAAERKALGLFDAIEANGLLMAGRARPLSTGKMREMTVLPLRPSSECGSGHCCGVPLQGLSEAEWNGLLGRGWSAKIDKSTWYHGAGIKKSASDTRHLLCVTERRAEGAVQSNIMGQQNAGYAKGGG